MIGTSARLLQLLGLLQGRGTWPGAELAGRLGVDVRTLRRDIDKLRALGYTIRSTAGVAGGYQLGAGETVPPLLLSDEEAVSVAVSLLSRTIAGEAGQELAVLAKLEQLLPPRLRRRVRALANSTEAMSWSEVPAMAPGRLLDLAVASRQREEMAIRYRDREDKITRRHIEPHGLVSAGCVWYMVAWDLSRDDWRTFRLDRVEEARGTGRQFAGRKVPKGAAAFVSESVKVGSYRYEVKFSLLVPYEEARQKISARAGKLEPEGAESCVLWTGTAWMEELAAYLAGRGIEFAVVEPRELAERLEAVGERCLRAARASREFRR